MENGEYIKKVMKRKDADDRGKSLDPQGLAARTYSPEDEEYVMALPVYPLYSTQVQAPDGTFYFMLGYDGLGEAPLA